MVRFFGKPSSGAFTISRYPDLGHPDWFMYMANGSAYMVSDHEYICHTGVQPNEEVWLTQDGVVNGNDDVVESAMNWINGNIGLAEEYGKQGNGLITQFKNFPNPFHHSTTITYTISNDSYIRIVISDGSGRDIMVLCEGHLASGEYSERWDGLDNNGLSVPVGIYNCRIQAENEVRTIRMINID